ncbi:class I SAM-dependent methyltransferase [Streptomyces actinomycinicus]|nr:class I SAM-dependent methyltransferase [Streptomyces actinomycinicus]
MSAPPAVAWAGADPYAAALRAGHGPLFLRRADGWLLPLEVERWCARADAVDRTVLDRCEGAVLDVGCGPGRLVVELAARGRTVLGIDVSEAAVDHTVRRLRSPLLGLGRERRDGQQRDRERLDRERRDRERRDQERLDQERRDQERRDRERRGPEVGRGGALRRSVFEPLPGEGRWGTVLLMDGNIGIGGDPRTLLDRVARLLCPGGLLIAETAAVDVDELAEVQVVDVTAAGTGGGGAFPWARVGTPALLRYAQGWVPAGQWTAGGRRFVALRSRTARSSAEPPKSTAVISSQRAG